jgi:hypothetical protein
LFKGEHAPSPRTLLLIFCFFLFASGCKKPEPEKVYNIYFVPIADAPVSEIQGLLSHYRQKFGLESTVLPRFAPQLRTGIRIDSS